MSAEIVVPITRVRQAEPGAPPLPLPRYMTPGSAGMDIAAALTDPVVLAPLQRSVIPTGFALALPQDYEAQVRPRSGLALRRGLTILNAPGTIDADYREEVKILLVNLGDKPVEVKRGDRIAQLIIAPVARARWTEVDRLGATQRHGGFGHTGTAARTDRDPADKGKRTPQ